MTTLPAPLQVVRSTDCGPVHVEVAYVPATDPDHVSGDASGDPYRDRIEIRLTDRGLPEGAVFEFQSPQPLQFFFTILRRVKEEEGETLLDLTEPQIDAHHTGDPQPRQMSFNKEGEALVDETSYFALATILPHHEILPGEYLLRICAFEMLRVEGSAYAFEPLELPLTIVDPADAEER